MRWLALLLVVACAHGPLRPPARAADPGAKLVRAVWYNPDAVRWRSSVWFRADVDLVTPMRIVISSDDSGCLMGNEIDEPRALEYYVCPSGWRYPQRRF